MTTVPSADPTVPLHRRSIEYEVFDAGENLAVVGRLRDTRPWASGTGEVERVHDMELRVTVRIDDMSIIEADAVMHTFPHVECPAIVAAFRSLVGLNVARGYTREVQSRFSGAKGCAHLEHLARSLGPVVVQAVTSRRALAVARGEADQVFATTGTPWIRNTCHVWVDGGVAEQKLAAGWRPGFGPYPNPSLETFRSGNAPG